ncbi:MAG: carbohydrate kinase family protein [Acidobacteriota bacterium]
MPTLDLLTVGEAFDDLVFIGLPHLPRPGEEVKTSAFHRTIGGGAVITAVAAARLGVTTRVLSGLGPDAVARLEREGVSVGNLRRPGEPHAITAALSTRADRSFVTFNGVNDELESRLAVAVPRARARHVHFAFYPRDCARWIRIVEVCRSRGMSTSWDFGWNRGLLADRRFATLARALDVLFLNEKEAVLYARRRSLGAAIDDWRRHPHAVVLKLGKRGSRFIAREVDVAEPSPRVAAVDTTGAGDAFNGGFLYARLRGLPPRACLKTGNFIGARSTRRPGGVDGLPRRAALPKWAR